MSVLLYTFCFKSTYHVLDGGNNPFLEFLYPRDERSKGASRNSKKRASEGQKNSLRQGRSSSSFFSSEPNEPISLWLEEEENRAVSFLPAFTTYSEGIAS